MPNPSNGFRSSKRVGTTVTPESVDPVKWGRFLIAVFDEWVRRDVGDVTVSNFGAALDKWLGESNGPCIVDETCGCSLAVTSDGSLFSCDRFRGENDRCVRGAALRRVPDRKHCRSVASAVVSGPGHHRGPAFSAWGIDSGSL